MLYYRAAPRCVIPFFQIQFVVDRDISAGTASAKAMVKLIGPTPEQMQAMTDRLCAGFVSDPTAAGVTVIGADAVRRYPKFVKLQDAGKPSGTKVDDL